MNTSTRHSRAQRANLRRLVVRGPLVSVLLLVTSTTYWATTAYGQGVVSKRVAVDFDAPVKFRISTLLEHRIDRQRKIAVLHNVCILFEPPIEMAQPNALAAPLADGGLEEDSGDAPIDRNADPAPRIQFSGGTVDEFIFGTSKNGNSTAGEALTVRLNNLFQNEVEAIHAVCNLTSEQRNRLALAGRGDIQRFLDRTETLKTRFQQSDRLQTEDQFCRWVVPLGAEAEKLGRLLDSGLFDVNSLFSKTLNTTLSRDQLDRLIAQPRGVRMPEFPSVGWVGGPAPVLKGQPYLIHFWATQSAACKPNLPVLKKLAADGASIIGIHPVPMPIDKIANFIREEQLPYPTLTGSNQTVGPFMNVKDCRVKKLPYCIVVDRNGLVAACGMLGPELIAKFQELREESAVNSKD